MRLMFSQKSITVSYLKVEHEEFLDKYSKNMSIAALQKHLFDCVMQKRESILKY